MAVRPFVGASAWCRSVEPVERHLGSGAVVLDVDVDVTLSELQPLRRRSTGHRRLLRPGVSGTMLGEVAVALLPRRTGS